MSDGYQVDPEAMQRITQGINQAMAELKEFGFDIEANLGRGFDDLSLTGLEAGDDGLQQVFGDFCDRWGWGVRSLMGDANEFAGRLGLSAGIYHEQEQYVSDTLKTVWTMRHRQPLPLPGGGQGAFLVRDVEGQPGLAGGERGLQRGVLHVRPGRGEGGLVAGGGRRFDIDGDTGRVPGPGHGLAVERAALCGLLEVGG